LRQHSNQQKYLQNAPGQNETASQILKQGTICLVSERVFYLPIKAVISSSSLARWWN